MKKRLDIICHAFPSWRGDYMKSTVQLMKELAENNNVLYIDYAYSIKDILINRYKNKYIQTKRILGITNSIETIELKKDVFIRILSLPPIIPFNWINNNSLLNFVQAINNLIINRRIKSALKALKINSPIVVNAFNPFFDSFKIKSFHAKAVIYYCYDNINATVWASKHGAYLESVFLQKVNAVIFSSEALQISKSLPDTKSYVVNNGVDLSLFEDALVDGNVSNANNEICIGYVGTVDDRLDYNLLEKVIRQYPEWKFHFIGRILTDLCDDLKKYTNVSFFGPVDIHQLASMMKHFTVGIIPFVKNEFTRNIYPMKANEYLILGKAVIMTDFAVLNDLKGFVSVADNESFIEQIKYEIENDTLEKQQERINKARSNSWNNKAKEFENILSAYA